MKILVIDNFDLFTYSLANEFEKKDCETLIYRNHVDIRIIDNAIKKFKPQLIVISSGPGNVTNSGNSIDVIKTYSGKLPIFGVGLGHQCIVETFGGKIGKSHVVLHGKTSNINHDEKTIFKRLDNPFSAGRYNSLAGIDIPYSLEVSARDENDIVMGVRHKEYFVEGIQFHPESILTVYGDVIIENLVKEVIRK